MSDHRIREHLTSIRDGMKKVCLITQGLGAEPRLEDLENALFMREAVLSAEVDKKAVALSIACPEWHARVKDDERLRKILGEAEDLMHSIVRMDETISKTFKHRMCAVKTKLTTLYQTSRAASSYTAQSKLRAELISKA
jgi:hypothetical protein